jgi:Clp amino terminal domain, pathogenicity island component
LFERFTERSRQVVALAQEEARTLKHGHLGTEHILLGLLREHDGVAAAVLESSDVTLERTRGEVVRIVGVGQDSHSSQIPFTPRGKQSLELALGESLNLGHSYIDPEHILLALTTLAEATAVRILRDFHVEPNRVRAEVLQTVVRPSESAQADASSGPTTPGQPPASGNGFDEWIRVGPGAGVRRLLMVAAARALLEGREDIQPRDVLLALVHDDDTGPVLADLGVDDAAIRRAIERPRPPRGPVEG